MDIEKVKKGLKACSEGIVCGDECPYESFIFDPEKGCGCHAELAKDALALIEAFEAGKAKARALLDGLEKAEENLPEDGSGAMPAHIVPRGLLLHTWGHGWEERHMVGDDEDPERFVLAEAVWINGYILTEDGSSPNADSEYWKDRYNCTYGVRVWTGDEKPTEEQRKAAHWDGDPA